MGWVYRLVWEYLSLFQAQCVILYSARMMHQWPQAHPWISGFQTPPGRCRVLFLWLDSYVFLSDSKTKCSVQECLTSISGDWRCDDLYYPACSWSPTPPDFSNQCTVFCWTDTTLYFRLAKVKITDNFKYGWWCGETCTPKCKLVKFLWKTV